MRTWSNIKLLWAMYLVCPLGVRMRVLIRFLTCPFELFLKMIPKAGRILDVGCGDGQLLFWLTREPGTERQALGIDFDEEKIHHAAQVGISQAEFRSLDVGHLPSESFDVVCIAHVMYLIPLNQWPCLLKECLRVLKKGGRLVIMESVSHLSWKSRLAHVQELISVRVTRMTKGEVVASWPSQTYRRAIEQSGGFQVCVERADKGYLHPHVLFTAYKE
jgi:ubiquinone/menaquinone biosynthesis C-methylase UbiE